MCTLHRVINVEFHIENKSKIDPENYQNYKKIENGVIFNFFNFRASNAEMHRDLVTASNVQRFNL